MKNKSALLLTMGLGLALAAVWLLIFSSFGALEVQAASLTVCPAGPPTCDYSVIQDAVDAAVEGDVIKVAAGTYDDVNNHGGLAQVVYIVKSITIQGGYTTAFTEPPDPMANPTTLDAKGLGRVIYIEGDISPTIAGLRITGGNATIIGSEEGGGGVKIASSAAILRNNEIISNTADGGGGVLINESDNIMLSANIIMSNTGITSGGGVECSNSENIKISSNTFSNNSAPFAGGLNISCTGLLNNNLISHNTANQGGGLVACDISIEGNSIIENTAVEGAGGLHLWGCEQTTLARNIISDNTASWGGGVQVGQGSFTFLNNIITNNHADHSAGVLVGESTVDFLHNTLAQNHNVTGIGIWVDGSSEVTLTNTIIVSHPVGIDVASGGIATIDSTLWGSGTWANDTDWQGAGTIKLSNNQWGDPDFVDYLAGDYHIGENSDAIDAGIDAGVTTDFDNHPRPYQLPDISADEYWPPGTLKFIYLPLVLK